MRFTSSGFDNNSSINESIRSKVMAVMTLTTIMSAAVMITSCSREPSKEYLPADSIVVALGDSLTYGYGATPQTSYPAILGELTGWQVINAGVNGNISADVLARSAAVIAQNPDLVLLGVGGNDVLRRTESMTTKANISATIKTIKAANIPVVLIADPHFSSSALFGKASDNPIYKEIAASEEIPLYSKGWSQVLSDDSLKSDQIHANAAGYRHFAEGLYAFLQDEGLAQ